VIRTNRKRKRKREYTEETRRVRAGESQEEMKTVVKKKKKCM